MKLKKAVKLMQKGEKVSSEIMDKHFEYVYYDTSLGQFCYSHKSSSVYTQYVFDIEDILTREWTTFEGEA